MLAGTLKLLGGLVVAALIVGSATASETPASVVRKGVNEVLALVQDESLDTESRRARMRASIEKRFNFQAMSRSILARNWRKATTGQQARFVVLFKKLLENTYIAAIESYTSEEIKFGHERIAGERATVGVQIVLKSGSEAPLLFKLRKQEQGWHVYDVVIEGVSLVSNYRTSFRSVVRRDGISGLLRQLDNKLNKANAETTPPPG